MTKLISLVLFVSSTHAWIAQKQAFSIRQQHPQTKTALSSTADPTNPCWQDLYDDDCTMDNAYAASFVASEWLKKMPCAAGIEDCDMPDDLKLPGNRADNGAEEVDVMKFLNLKRAGGVDQTSED